MFSWPELGTRVTVRYRRASGSVPPLTDAVGHLLAVDPVVRVQTKTGAVAEFPPGDVVALRVLTDAPVRTSDIRSVEHAAASAWPGEDRAWLDGWLLRVGHGSDLAANSAVPLDVSAGLHTIPAIVAWYRHRGRTPRLAIPDRLLAPPPGLTSEHTERVLVHDVSQMAAAESDPVATVSAGPNVINGELTVAIHPGAGTVRAAVSDAPDGTRWVGLSITRLAPGRLDDRSAVTGCETLLAWGAHHGATRAYLYVPGSGATPLADALGFRLHHRRRYFPARLSSSDSV